MLFTTRIVKVPLDINSSSNRPLYIIRATGQNLILLIYIIVNLIKKLLIIFKKTYKYAIFT